MDKSSILHEVVIDDLFDKISESSDTVSIWLHARATNLPFVLQNVKDDTISLFGIIGGSGFEINSK